MRREETAGAIEIVDGWPQRQARGRVDYTLRVSKGMKVAVLVRRIEQLEREVQRWRIVGAIGFLAMAVLAVLAQLAGTIIRTERLVVPGGRSARPWGSPN
ncbi:MAG: hypothetical protein ACREOF_06195 [Gemmatimonadales bacterium]